METNCRGITRSYTGDYDKLLFAGRRLAKKGTLVLVRGLPGSGKSHLAEELRSLTSAEMGVCSADDFFYENGVYNFDPSKLAEAHLQCQSNTFARYSIDDIAFVANTFTQRWEMQSYLVFVETFGLNLLVLNLFDAGLSDEQLAQRNTHGVPMQAIAQMRARFEHDWKSGDPRPPWEREG